MPYSLKCLKPAPYFYLKADRAKIGKHIRKVRRERQLSQVQAANAIGVTDVAISHWEYGRHVPQHWLVGAIIEFLEYDPFDMPDER